MSEAAKQPEPQKPSPEKIRVVVSFGATWADLFDQSFARQLTKIIHLPLGDPAYRISQPVYQKIATVKSDQEQEEEFRRLNSRTSQASELIFKFTWHVKHASVILMDSKMLDTAIGQFVLTQAQLHAVPVYGVSTDDKSSPLAAAYLKAMLYPSTPDDLVKACLS